MVNKASGFVDDEKMQKHTINLSVLRCKVEPRMDRTCGLLDRWFARSLAVVAVKGLIEDSSTRCCSESKIRTLQKVRNQRKY